MELLIYRGAIERACEVRPDAACTLRHAPGPGRREGLSAFKGVPEFLDSKLHRFLALVELDPTDMTCRIQMRGPLLQYKNCVRPVP